MSDEGDKGFTVEETKAIIRAAVQGAGGRGISGDDIETIYSKLWEAHVTGLLVEMVLKGELLVSLVDGELAFKSKEDAQ